MTPADLLHQLPDLNQFDKRVVACLTDLDLLDSYGYPRNEIVDYVAAQLVDADRSDCYYAVKYVGKRLQDLR
jgi:hypothetical protein